jgi:hypothetical protein
MTFLNRLFESIREALGGSAPELINFAEINRRHAPWPANTVRGRWLAGP